MTQLALDLGLPPESVIAPPIPLAAALKRELVTHMVAAISAVYQAGGLLPNAHPSPSSQNHPSAPAAQSHRVSAPVLGATGAASHRKPTSPVCVGRSCSGAGFRTGRHHRHGSRT